MKIEIEGNIIKAIGTATVFALSVVAVIIPLMEFRTPTSEIIFLAIGMAILATIVQWGT